MWEDKTVDYNTESSGHGLRVPRPVCGYLHTEPGNAVLDECNHKHSDQRKFLCQIPPERKQQRVHVRGRSVSQVSEQHSKSVSQSSSKQTLSSLAIVNVSVVGQHRRQWSMATCPTGHVTHALLVCDVSAFCWADSDVSFSLQAETWALPAPQSCPVQLGVTSLPPSFSCHADERHVPYSLMCDHRRDCLDGSDETFCKFTPCGRHFHFQCLNKQVWGLFVCLLAWLLLNVFYTKLCSDKVKCRLAIL